jgi:hypothetical protein
MSLMSVSNSQTVLGGVHIRRRVESGQSFLLAYPLGSKAGNRDCYWVVSQMMQLLKEPLDNLSSLRHGEHQDYSKMLAWVQVPVVAIGLTHIQRRHCKSLSGPLHHTDFLPVVNLTHELIRGQKRQGSSTSWRNPRDD